MTLNATSLAAAVGAGVQNVRFSAEAINVPRKIAIIGTYDPAILTIVDEVPALITSAADAGDKYGFGFMIHRLAVQAFAGSNGVETYVIPQAEDGGGVQGAGDVTFTASSLQSGTVYMYIAGIPVPFTVTSADDSAAVATKAAAAITANNNLPVTAIATLTVIDITSKSEGPWGNDITIDFNLGFGQETPSGLTIVITDMASGAGVPTIADALDGTGTGDDANEDFFTDVVHGYGQDTTTLDAISTYVGAGNDFVGLYDKLVARPFRVLTGDTVAGSSGLTALIALGNGRKLDRANGVVAVPGSANHPSEIAAQTIGQMARINNDRAAQSYIGISLIDIFPGAKADRWTSDYDSRDTAVKAGVSPTTIESGVVTLQNVVTFYHPDSVPVESNGYRSMRNISILQNIMDNVKSTFGAEKWQGISIVEDTAAVTSVTDRLKARDIESVLDELATLAVSFAGKAWLYNSAFTIEKLAEPGAVTIRSGNTGFDNILSVILSGEGAILDTVTQFDTSIAVLLV